MKRYKYTLTVEVELDAESRKDADSLISCFKHLVKGINMLDISRKYGCWRCMPFRLKGTKITKTEKSGIEEITQ